MEKFTPHDYQQYAFEWMVHNTLLAGRSGAGLLLDPGLGKTAITLMWLNVLQGRKALVIAPLRVVYSVWPQEIQKWEQFSHMRTSIVHGSPAQRRRRLAKDADIYLINPENVQWLFDYHKETGCLDPISILAVDESSKFRSWSSKRTRCLRKLIDADVFDYRTILTGTPCPKSLEDLFPQAYLLDKGQALGTTITKYRNRWFYRGGYQGYEWIPTEGAQAGIERLIAPMCLRLDAKDHLDLPDLVINDVWIDLPLDLMEKYRKFERELFIELDGDDAHSAVNAGSKYLSCRQIANGGLYTYRDDIRSATHLHELKLDALEEIVGELQGKPVLVPFLFRHDLERLQKRFPGTPAIYGGTKPKIADSLIEQWNRGNLSMLLVQPESMSHGLNLQSGPGRDIVWVGLTDNLETFQQLNARIYRQGVEGQVRVHRILARGTVEVAVRYRLNSKDQSQSALLQALKKYKENTNND